MVRELAARTGESITEAVTKAVEERIDRHRRQSSSATSKRAAELHAIFQTASRLPIIDPTAPEDEILDYKERGSFD